MSTNGDRSAEPSEFARLAAGILFAMVVGMGYVVSPPVESAVELPAQVEEQDTVQTTPPAPGCATAGLVLAECNLDV